MASPKYGIHGAIRLVTWLNMATMLLHQIWEAMVTLTLLSALVHTLLFTLLEILLDFLITLEKRRFLFSSSSLFLCVMGIWDCILWDFDYLFCVISKAFVVGHDYGAIAAWHLSLFRPDRVRALVALSAPYFERSSSTRSSESFRQSFGDGCYVCQFQVLLWFIHIYTQMYMLFCCQFLIRIAHFKHNFTWSMVLIRSSLTSHVRLSCKLVNISVC